MVTTESRRNLGLKSSSEHYPNIWFSFFPARGFKISQTESRENLVRTAYLNKQMLYSFPAKNHDAHQIISLKA